MPAPRPWIGLQQLHLLGKVLDRCTPDALVEIGLNAPECAEAGRLFDAIDAYLRGSLCKDWDITEVNL